MFLIVSDFLEQTLFQLKHINWSYSTAIFFIFWFILLVFYMTYLSFLPRRQATYKRRKLISVSKTYCLSFLATVLLLLSFIPSFYTVKEERVSLLGLKIVNHVDNSLILETKTWDGHKELYQVEDNSSTRHLLASHNRFAVTLYKKIEVLDVNQPIRKNLLVRKLSSTSLLAKDGTRIVVREVIEP